jgi:predicted secreted protein
VRGMVIAAIIMLMASLATFVILPMRVRPAKEEDQTTPLPEIDKETTPISPQ